MIAITSYVKKERRVESCIEVIGSHEQIKGVLWIDGEFWRLLWRLAVDHGVVQVMANLLQYHSSNHPSISVISCFLQINKKSGLDIGELDRVVDGFRELCCDPDDKHSCLL